MATTNKYDRQLRLWGSNGQKALSESVIILFSATSAGTESLKNLVLPGCGSFHIIDDDDDRQVVGSSGEGDGNGNGDGDNDGDGKTMTPFHNFFVFPEQPSQTTPASGVRRHEVKTKNQRHTFFVIPEDNDDETPPTSTKSSSSKAEVATKNLMELNPDVLGGHTTLPSPLSNLLQSSDSDSNSSSTSSGIYDLINTIRIERKAQWNNLIILGADLSPGDTSPLADFCWNGHTPSTTTNTTNTNTNDTNCPPIPLVLVRSYGLLGTVRVQIRDRPIIESKPENVVEDLRLASCSEGKGGGGFSELWDLAEGIDLDALDERDHAHVPFVVILLKALDRWRTAVTGAGAGEPQSGARLPHTFAEKNEFKSVIRSMSRDINKEVNFTEAMDYSYLAYTKMELSYETQCLLDASEATLTKKAATTTATPAITQFDLLLRALAIFIDTSPDKQSTPVHGSIPDMASSTQGFVELQTMYRTKANSDKERMRSILTELVTQYPTAQAVRPDDEELATFCKNVHCLRYISTRSYSAEYDLTYPDDDDDNDNDNTTNINNDSKSDIQGEIVAATYDPYEDAEQTPLLWYVALRACDSFWEEHGVWPGGDGRVLALEGDAVEVQGFIKALVGRMGFGGEGGGSEVENDLIQSTLLALGDGGGSSSSKYAKEVVRYFNAELHNVASVVGGVASQEAVKLITGQYVPMDGTYVFNGIASVSGVYKF